MHQKYFVIHYICIAFAVTVFSSFLMADEPDEAASAAEEKTGSKWNVNEPPGPCTEVHIDTDEGTWMNLDVSPDGSEIVFDLLGDIYSIPTGGGRAKTLTDGMSWEMQPRYSPCGKYIAFVSDRDGKDNIWVMESDGSNPRQITKEDYRLVHSPAWAPDGMYIAGRKHFTSTRSLGAGEVWLYHIAGGQGVQMTKKPNDQKDLNEPVFSPDGRYVYFSQDVSPGDEFEYNRDVNGQIYIIKRLDRNTGEIERFITGQGGSVRPTPSPDGRFVAFVRRVRYKSTLFLHEIRSGAEWPVYDELDRDMQETWAIHGVYPSMAWTPDNKSIIFWAGGRIKRIDIQTKKVTVIPFRVETTRKITEAVRYPVNVSPDKFKVRMLRWVQVSPDGKSVVYQALGHLYIRSLPDGLPKRLTSRNDQFEFFPSWSRDGKWIVYTTWNDEKLGSVRVISAAGGSQERVIASQPGHYVEPVFSPDSATIVYRKIDADRLRSPTWQQDTGVYSVPAARGRANLVCKDGQKPFFGAENDRIFLIEYDKTDGSKRILVSIDLDGSDRRVHFAGENTTDFAVSGDGRWLAFTERFNAYVMPFVQSGSRIDIGPKMKSIPLKKVSDYAGDYLHFSASGEKLYWSLGPELFSCRHKDAFEVTEDVVKPDQKVPVEKLDISFDVKTDAPDGRIALIGGRIITMQGDEVIESGTILIDGNRITKVGPADSFAVPDDAFTLDVKGKTIMPGIIDVHSHGPQGGDGLIPQRNWGHYANLAFGVTTNHDPSNDTGLIFAASELQRAGAITAPRIFSTGTILYGASGPAKAQISSLDDALSHLRRMKAVGAFSVKSYNQPGRDQRQQIIAAARQLEMMVVAEGGSLFDMNMTMIVDGHTGIEHTIPVEKAYDDVISLWAASRTGVTPTLVVGYGGAGGEYYWYQHTNVWENNKLLTFVPRTIVDQRSRRRTMLPEEEFNHIRMSQICKKLSDAGISIQLGAHGQLAGLAAHWELWMLAQGGMTEHQALKAATINGAKYLGLDGDIGSVQPGKLADLIVLDKNPLDNIRNSQTVVYTVINGRIYDSQTMDEIGAHPVRRGRFYWEIDYSAAKLTD